MADITVVRFKSTTVGLSRQSPALEFYKADNDEMAVEVAPNKLRNQTESTVVMFESKFPVIGKELNFLKGGGVEWI